MRRFRFPVTLFAILLCDSKLRVYEYRFGDRTASGPREIFDYTHKWVGDDVGTIDLECLKHRAVAIANELRQRAGYRLVLPVSHSERLDSLNAFMEHFASLKQLTRARPLGNALFSDNTELSDIDSIMTAMAVACHGIMPCLFGWEDVVERLLCSTS